MWQLGSWDSRPWQPGPIPPLQPEEGSQESTGVAPAPGILLEPKAGLWGQSKDSTAFDHHLSPEIPTSRKLTYGKTEDFWEAIFHDVLIANLILSYHKNTS